MNVEIIKQLVIESITKVLQNDNIVSIFQNNKVITAISKGLELKSKISEEVEVAVKGLQETLAIASIDDLRNVERKVQKTEKKLTKLTKPTKIQYIL